MRSDWKQPSVLSIVGLALVGCGEVLRKMAMIKAGTNFSHYIRHVRESGHILVTDGIFGMFRHPAYVGWFYWSIGTQVLIHSVVKHLHWLVLPLLSDINVIRLQ